MLPGSSYILYMYVLPPFPGGEKASNLPTLMSDYVSQMQPPVATQWQALVASTTVEQLEADTSTFASQSFDFVGGRKRLDKLPHTHTTQLTLSCYSVGSKFFHAVFADKGVVSQWIISNFPRPSPSPLSPSPSPPPPPPLPPLPRLIQMSRIRRMCRLLVDCDMNTPTRRAMELGIEPNTADLRTSSGWSGEERKESYR